MNGDIEAMVDGKLVKRTEGGDDGKMRATILLIIEAQAEDYKFITYLIHGEFISNHKQNKKDEM